jgi:non-heme chloroperoxidase
MPYATINGIELFYEDNGARRPVVFLHGWGTSGRVWGAQVADRASTLAGWVPHWYGPAVGPAMHEWTVRQILDSGVFIDELFTEAATFDPREIIGGLAVLVTFLHGRLDTEVPLEVSQTLAALAPRGEVHIIEGAGHMPHQEQPIAVTVALRAALR